MIGMELIDISYDELKQGCRIKLSFEHNSEASNIIKNVARNRGTLFIRVNLPKQNIQSGTAIIDEYSVTMGDYGLNEFMIDRLTLICIDDMVSLGPHNPDKPYIEIEPKPA